jgi:tripartite-type tricarboxylate transporter receptor subunit TctC
MGRTNLEARKCGRSGVRRLAATGFLAIAALGLGTGEGLAQTYPNKPIAAVVPFGAGGGADTQTRIWGDAMAGLTGQRVVVENVAGSAGIAGTKQGIAAEPDGYTVVMGAASTIAINPATNKAANYNALTDLRPVALIGYTPYVLVVANALKVKTLPDLIQYGKANPGKLTYAGWTAVGEFARKGLELRTGLVMTPVPYKGATEAMTDVIAGRASASILDISTALPFIRAGNVTAIAITGPTKSPALPEVPSIAEAGVKDYVIDSWIGLFAPKDTSDEIVTYLNAKTREALQTQKARDRYAELEIERRDYSVEETQDFMKRQVNAWSALIKETGGTQ